MRLPLRAQRFVSYTNYMTGESICPKTSREDSGSATKSEIPSAVGSREVSASAQHAEPSAHVATSYPIVMARDPNAPSLETLLRAIRACRACEAHLRLGPRPILQANAAARILVVGQAPGARVHRTQAVKACASLTSGDGISGRPPPVRRTAPRKPTARHAIAGHSGSAPRRESFVMFVFRYAR